MNLKGYHNSGRRLDILHIYTELRGYICLYFVLIGLFGEVYSTFIRAMTHSVLLLKDDRLPTR